SPLRLTSVTANADVHGDRATVAVRAAGTYENEGREETWSVGNDCVSGQVMSWCLSPQLPLFFGSVPHTATAPTNAESVRIGGRWFTSPVSTLTNVIDGWVGELDLRTLYGMVGDFKDIPPDGSLVLGREVTTPAAGGRLAPYAYSFHGTAGQSVIGTS